MENAAWTLVLAPVDALERADGRGGRLPDILFAAPEVEPPERTEGEELEDVDPRGLLCLVRGEERVAGRVRLQHEQGRALGEEVPVSHPVHDLAVVALDTRDRLLAHHARLESILHVEI